LSPAATIWITGLVFGLTYLGLALGRIPGLRMDRAGIALVGATLMIVTGVVSLTKATQAVDYRTIVLLFGMMVVVGFLRIAGFFERLAAWALERVHHPLALLGATVGLSGTLSAFLVNDIVCVALTPLIVHLARRLHLNPLPHLIGLATAANIGSSATITGNPQNMIIGQLSQIRYLDFVARLAPIALIGLVLDFAVIALIYRQALQANETADPAPLAASASRHSRRRHRKARRAKTWLLIKSLTVTVAAVVLFFAGLPIDLVALGAAAVLLLSRVRPSKIYRQVDWSLLVMFCGLFVVVYAFDDQVVKHWNIGGWDWLQRHPVDLLSVVSAGLSNLVSNVPAVLLFKPIIPSMPAESRDTAWLALAMSSTMAGNLTVLGSVANLIVVESARREGIAVSFWEYCRVGVPITLLTLAIGIAWLEWVPY
jgi:Na+/H+ antiporter NhaD/arsenite permease-like protein